MTHTCETCLKVFKQKGHLSAHHARKTPCSPPANLEQLINDKVQEKVNEALKQLNMNVHTEKNEIIVPAEPVPVVKRARQKIAKAEAKHPEAKHPEAKPVEAKPVEAKHPEAVSLQMIDLFAGTGAFSSAFESTNAVQCVFANDMVPWSKVIYDANHSSSVVLLQDLNTVPTEEIPRHDLLTGGFPCQPFSIAGKREGFDDARSNVFWKILEIIDHHRPRALVLENVKNLVSHDEGRTFTTIKENVEQRGYHLRYKVLDTAEITGVPQHRERIYLVCLKEKAVFDRFSLDFPLVERRLITELLEPASAIPDKYYYTAKSAAWRLISEGVTERGVVYQYRRVYVRANKSGVCPTLTANMGSGGDNVGIVLDERGIRKLTPRECFRFQGFPDSYILPEKLADCNLYKLAGNAVSHPVVKLIADRLVPLLLEIPAIPA